MSDDAIKAAEDAAGREITFLRDAAIGWTLRTKIEAAIAVALLVAAIAVWAFRPAKPVPEVVKAMPQVEQKDGSVIAAETPPPADLPPPPHMLPRGSHEERRTHVVVHSSAPAASACPPVTVDLSLIRNADNTRRVVASSPDGTVLSATDIPIDPAPLPPPVKPWAAGLSYGTGHAVGLWIERDIGKLRAGIDIERGPTGKADARVRLGVRF